MDLEKFLAGLDAAITTAAGRLGEISMEVESVDVTVATAFAREMGGQLELKVLSLGASRGREDSNEVTLSFVPRGIVPAATLESELIDAIEVVELGVEALASTFTLLKASVELACTTTTEGKIRLVLGGESSSADTHTVRLNLRPVA